MAVKTTTITGLEERQHVVDALRRREHELRARGLTRLALFGSTARGDMGPESDVDLLIEVDPERGFGLFAFLDLKDDLARLLGRPVDLAFPDAMRPQPAHGRAARRSRGVLIAAPRDPRIVLEHMLEAIVDTSRSRLGGASRPMPPTVLPGERSSAASRSSPKPLAAIGNVLRHDYGVVNDATIWHAATVDLLPLKAAVAALLREVDAAP